MQQNAQRKVPIALGQLVLALKSGNFSRIALFESHRVIFIFFLEALESLNTAQLLLYLEQVMKHKDILALSLHLNANCT